MQNSIIKDYHIQRELGRGGMATVYLAYDNKFDTNVALKVLNKEFIHNENIRKRFLAEAKNMFKMSHPNIIKVTDLIEEGDTVAFVMEYIEGETLKEYIDNKGKLSDDEIKTIFSQMLDAVGYVHKQKLVHRDIKPSNFMITHEGQIKLMDFGIAKTTDTSSAEYTQTGTGVQMGTPMYMSPEQITETKNVTQQSDIYSLGVVLWQMVTGQKPYDVRTLSSFNLQNKIVNENLPSTSSIFDTIIQKATQKHPEQRFQNIQAFQDAIKHPTKNTDLEQTIVNPKTVEEEETVVVQPNKKTNSAKSSKSSPTLKKESKTTNIPPLQEKKQRSNILIYISIGMIFLAFLMPIFKEKPVEIDEDVLVYEEVIEEASEEEEEVIEEAADDFYTYNLSVKTFKAGIRAVKIPGKNFYMGETEVTIGQYLQFCKAVGKHYPEWLEEGSKYNIYTGTYDYYKTVGMNEKNTNHPITGISWHDAVAFATWAGGRLPTEEEWQHAAKGGQNYTYAGSNNIDEVAWYDGNSNNKTHPVKSKKPNGYGLYDMSGNVWEWTNSWYDNSQSFRVLRGGSCYNYAEGCRAAYRGNDDPGYRGNSLGFRVLFP